MEMRKEIHDAKQTQGRKRLFLPVDGIEKKGNVIGLCVRPKRRRTFGLYRQIHMDI